MAKKSVLEEGMRLFEKYAKVAGTSLDSLDIETIKADAVTEAEIKEVRAAEVATSELVLKSLHYRHALMMKKCRWCGQTFSTNYCSVSLCSTACRKSEFYEKYGIRYGAINAPSLYEYEPASIIPPDDLKSLYEYAKALVAEYERVDFPEAGPEENPLRLKEQEVSLSKDGLTVTREIRRNDLVTQVAAFEPIVVPTGPNQEEETTRLQTLRGHFAPSRSEVSVPQNRLEVPLETQTQIPKREEAPEVLATLQSLLSESVEFEIPDLSF